ncbi:MAG: hypothetical protein ACR2RL_11495 [Gammaproteobacteria bacterium]
MAHSWFLRPLARCWCLLCLLSCCLNCAAHGGVFVDDDVCVIQIGFFKAHFTIFQPRTRASEEFCEDIPDVAESVFVLDYLHQGLKDMPVEFRIIRDTQNLGRFAKLGDVARIEDIEQDTVFHQDPVTRPDAVYSVVHEFEEAGSYIGIVTTRHPTNNRSYTAVFPFRVGGADYRYIALFIALIVFVQANYWIMGGSFSRWRAKWKKSEIARK